MPKWVGAAPPKSVSVSAMRSVSTCGSRPPAQTPSTRADRRRIIPLAAGGLFISGFNNFIVAVALLQLRTEFRLSPGASGEVAAAALAGMLVGSISLGRVADAMGRRLALVLDLALVAAFAILSALVSSPGELVGARVLLGIGVGAGYPIGAAYVADVSPDHSRGRLMVAAFSGWGFGALAAALAGWAILALDTGSQGWRLMLLLGAVPALLLLLWVAISSLPESPRWANSRSLDRLPASCLLAPAYRRLTVAACVPWFLMDVSVYGIGLFTPVLLLGLGLRAPDEVALGTGLLALVTLAGMTLAALVIDHLGRRLLQIAGFVGMAASLVLVGIVGTHPSVLLLLAVFAGFQLSANLGPNTTTWIVPAELFPTRLRATGQGSATAFSRLGAMLGVLLLPTGVAAFGLAITLYLVAAVSILGAILTLLLLPETRGTRLED
ncbi:MAG: MFS transporter [Acidimicrobiales bacterium]